MASVCGTNGNYIRDMDMEMVMDKEMDTETETATETTTETGAARWHGKRMRSPVEFNECQIGPEIYPSFSKSYHCYW